MQTLVKQKVGVKFRNENFPRSRSGIMHNGWWHWHDPKPTFSFISNARNKITLEETTDMVGHISLTSMSLNNPVKKQKLWDLYIQKITYLKILRHKSSMILKIYPLSCKRSKSLPISAKNQHHPPFLPTKSESNSTMLMQ